MTNPYSASQIKMFRDCKRKMIGMPGKTSPYAELGTYIHKEFEKMLREKNIYKERKLAQAMLREKNKEERAARSPVQQLAVLDERLGKGVGAKKERARLAREIKMRGRAS